MRAKPLAVSSQRSAISFLLLLILIPVGESLVYLRYGLSEAARPSRFIAQTQEATPFYPTFTPSPTPTATPTLVGTIESLGHTVNAYFKASTTEPLTGYPFTITMTIELPEDATLTEAPEFSDPWEPFMLRSVGELITESPSRYTQEMTVILWRPGYYRTPETFIGYTFGSVDETLRVPVQPEFITVPTVLDAQDYNLRPFKPLVYLSYLSPLVVIGALIVGIGAIRGGIYWYQRRPVKTKEVAPPNPFDIAIESLRDLKNVEDMPEDTVSRAADVLRQYLRARFEVPALDMTTAETIEALQANSPLSEKLLTELNRLLSETDVIKFANTQPEGDLALRIVDMAVRWISFVEKRNL